ncbi:hypothetical protein GCM10023201_30880 [Actinomycetospora corticicola]|uniref:ARB-07466-like C-terminal domain-containing protein n=1 Tax=Actinomycetospora corticicola TaxID=663602 RepID=A0A7Y9DUC0_9PSEU|nr:hypothetical protein [Actinomycetospora corticicola]
MESGGVATVDAPTTVLDLAALVADRQGRAGYTPDGHGRPARRAHARSAAAARDARRHGLVAAGVATVALAAVTPAALQLPAGDDATLELSAQGTRLEPAATAPAVTPVVVNAASDPATADLFKAGDRVRRQAEQASQAAAAEQARAAEAEQARAATERAASITSCGADSSYGGVADSVQTVGNALECVFPGHDVLGVGSRGNASDHPGGYALDFMTTSGDAIAECVIDNKDALGVSYAIWDQRINTGSGWKSMEDRGGATANHEDHVHISFERGADPDVSALRSCT